MADDDDFADREFGMEDRRLAEALASLYNVFRSKSKINWISVLALTIVGALVWADRASQPDSCYPIFAVFIGGFTVLAALITILLLFELLVGCCTNDEEVHAIDNPRLACSCIVVSVKVLLFIIFVAWSVVGIAWAVDVGQSPDCTYAYGPMWAFLVSLLFLLLCLCSVCCLCCISCASYKANNPRRHAPPLPDKPMKYRADMFDDPEDAKCAICLEQYEERKANLQRLPCGHIFHHQCVDRWLHRSVNCPMCQQSVVELTTPAEPANADTDNNDNNNNHNNDNNHHNDNDDSSEQDSTSSDRGNDNDNDDTSSDSGVGAVARQTAASSSATAFVATASADNDDDNDDVEDSDDDDSSSSSDGGSASWVTDPDFASADNSDSSSGGGGEQR